MTTQLFTRYGTLHTGPVYDGDKGQKIGLYPRKCSRCGGQGWAEKWRHTGLKCYDCGGSGDHINGPERVKLYTAEKLEKLNVTKAKADAKRAAKAQAAAAQAQAEADARADGFRAAYADLIAKSALHMEDSFIGDVMRRALERNEITEKQAEAVAAAVARIEERNRLRAASEFVGDVGKRLECKVTVERVSTFYRPAFNGFSKDEAVYIVTMRDEAGNAIVSKSSSFYAEAADEFTIRATVKEHSTYRDEKQTIVQRIKVMEEKAA